MVYTNYTSFSTRLQVELAAGREKIDSKICENRRVLFVEKRKCTPCGGIPRHGVHNTCGRMDRHGGRSLDGDRLDLKERALEAYQKNEEIKKRECETFSVNM